MKLVILWGNARPTHLMHSLLQNYTENLYKNSSNIWKCIPWHWCAKFRGTFKWAPSSVLSSCLSHIVLQRPPLFYSFLDLFFFPWLSFIFLICCLWNSDNCKESWGYSIIRKKKKSLILTWPRENSGRVYSGRTIYTSMLYILRRYHNNNIY